MSIALVTNYLPPYRLPLYELLAERYQVEVLCFGGDAAYVPEAQRDLDRQIEQAAFPARRLKRQRDASALAASHDAVIAATAGRVALPAAFRGARRAGRPFILWASLWRHPRTIAHAASFAFMRRVYRDADAVLTYGPHVSRYVERHRDSDQGVFAAPQAVEPDVFGQTVTGIEIEELRAGLGVPTDGSPIVLFVGRLVPEKGVELLLRVWRRIAAGTDATLCLVGDGPLAERAATLRGVRLAGRLDRERLPIAYAAANVLVVPSLRTRHFLEPWGLVCNEAMHQGTPVIASDAVGAAAGGLVRDEQTGLVVRAGDEQELARAIADVVADPAFADGLGRNARAAVSTFTYEAAADAFGRALDHARARLRRQTAPVT
ncbi:MAG: glycosyltransferase family 4 protein [Solirubrobacterales bacterium]